MADYAAPTEHAAAVEVTAVAVELPSLVRRVEYVETFLEETLEQRKLSMRDRDFYDGHQLSKDDIAKLRRRKQPEIVKNLIAPKVNFVLGEEILRRVDPVALPRTMQHESAARSSTDAMRFVEEEQQFDLVRTAVAKNLFVEGTGGALKELEPGPDRVRHRLRHIEWDRLLWDPCSRDLLFSDAKYLGLLMWMDLEDAVIRWPDAAEALEGAVMNSLSQGDAGADDKPTFSWTDANRKRVQVAELYLVVGGSWFRSCFTKAADLEEPGPTGYLDESGEKHLCPLQMASCYIDREGARYGIVRGMVSPQIALNKHSSKLLHMVTAKPVMAERDTVRDPQQFMAEIAKPDGFAETEPGALEAGRVRVIDQQALATAHLGLVQDAKADINGIGPTASQIPDMPASSSGRALLARQKAASQELGNPFDTIREWTKRIFELDWQCIRQHWSEEMWLRVTDDEERAGYRFVALNRRMTRAQRLTELVQQGTEPGAAFEIAAGTAAPWIMADVRRQLAMVPPQVAQTIQPMQVIASHPAMQEIVIENQVEQMTMDILVAEAPETAILQQEEFEKLIELAQVIVPQAPQMARDMARMVLKASSLRDKRELLEAFDKPPDPKAAQVQQAMQQLQLAGAKASVEVQQSQAHLNHARAAEAEADAQTAQPLAAAEVEAKKAQAMSHAASAGSKMATPMAPAPVQSAPRMGQGGGMGMGMMGRGMGGGRMGGM